jgi:hypothetical protein
MKSIHSPSVRARSWRMGPRLLAAGVAVAGVTLLASAVPANATTSIPRPPANARTVPMTASPNGVGVTPGDCGLAILWVHASSRAFSIDLISYDGDITGGWYTIWTDGLLEASQVGGFTLDGTSAYTDGNILDPGINVHNAYVLGTVQTIEGPCAFYAVAPWNDN